MLDLRSFPNIALSPGEAGRYLDRLRGVRLALVGDIMLDQYVRGTVERVSPEAPVPVVELEDEFHVPGGMANACVNAASLGAAAVPIGVLGDDEAGEQVAQILSTRGVTVRCLVRVPGRRTTVKTRIVANGQQIARVDSETRTPISAATEDLITGHLLDQIERADGLLICDYAKGLLSRRVLEQAIALARSRGKPVCVDPKRADFAGYRAATAITPNLKEAAAAAGLSIHSGADLVRAAVALKERAQCEHILITLGEGGMMLLDHDAECFHVPSTARQVFDVTGAGDTAGAALALSLAAGVSIHQATVIANCAAGLAVEKKGTASVTGDELRQQLTARVSAAGEVEKLREAPAGTERVGYRSGPAHALP